MYAMVKHDAAIKKVKFGYLYRLELNHEFLEFHTRNFEGWRPTRVWAIRRIERLLNRRRIAFQKYMNKSKGWETL